MKKLLSILSLSVLLWAGSASAKTVCTTVEEGTTTNVCHSETTYTQEEQCHSETYYTDDRVCDVRFWGICFSWKTVQTPHQKEVCETVQVPHENQVCQTVTTDPVESCEEVPDEPVVEPQEPEIVPAGSNAFICKIPSLVDYTYTKRAAGIYEFHFTGKNLSGSGAQIKWGRDLIDVSFSAWEKYEDTKLVFIPEGQERIFFWVRNRQSTGKILEVNL